ncbi:MAG: clan AA aspartic protease [Rubrobacteraceae bacterium]
MPGGTLRGRVVSGGREAVVALTVSSQDSDRSEPVEVEAVIDTGFSGHLTLPDELVEELDLPQEGYIEVELANGETDELGVFEARVRWHGREVSVPVYETDGGPLVGMSLLRGSRLTVEAEPGGEVLIEKLEVQMA